MLKVTILDAHVVDQRETLSAYQGFTVKEKMAHLICNVSPS